MPVVGVLLIGAYLLSGVSSPAAIVAPKYLLALGDSLAAGYQPTDGTTVLPPVDEATGFRDRGYPESYPADIAAARGLHLTDLACPGETTQSMIGTPALRQCAALYRSQLKAASQLTAATRYLSLHSHQVRLVTIDIGANDLERCVSGTGANLECLSENDVSTMNRLSEILSAVAVAVHKFDPGAPIVAMTYYDPFLGLEYAPGGTKGLELASETLAATDVFNSQLTTEFQHYGIRTADVANAFHAHAVSPKMEFAGKLLNENVATVCRLTWMCPNADGRSRDIHPRTAGYQAIAGAFEAALR